MGKITVLADNFNGKRFNSPNDIVCQSRTFDLLPIRRLHWRRMEG